MTLAGFWRLHREGPELPGTLATLAAFATLRGDESQARALNEAAAALEQLAPRARTRLARQLRARAEALPPGISPAAAAVISLIIESGRDAVVADARTRLAPDLARLLGVPGVSLDDVVTVHRRTGAVTAADLAAAVSVMGHPVADEDDALRGRIEAALPSLRAGHPRIPLGRAWWILGHLRERIERDLSQVEAVELSGSVRRFEPTVGDLELLVSAHEPGGAIEDVGRLFDESAVLHRSRHLVSATAEGDAVTVRAVSPEEFPFAQLYYTGSPTHWRFLEARAAARGWRLTSGALTDAAGNVVICANEAAVYAHLGLAYIAPELRHGEQEVTLAERGSLPALVSRQDIRGDLHTHTLWSDGRDSVDTMVRAARALGHEYVAITDHSPRAAASRVLTLDRLERQAEDVERARRRVPGIVVLHGAEVDILPDGSLDFPDEILARLDVVLASLHEPAGQSSDVLLERYLAAVNHPCVHIVTHPANRLPGRDEGYPLDFEALFEAAARTGTVLEIDGAPAHLDMDGHLARRAVAAGVLVSIDSDCHTASRLGAQMLLGVGTARRGGIEAQHVLNTRPVTEVRAHFAAKPARLAAGRS